MIVSNATIYPRESNKNNKKNQPTADSHQEEVQSYELAQLQTQRHLEELMLIPAVCGYFHSADSQGSTTAQMGTRE